MFGLDQGFQVLGDDWTRWRLRKQLQQDLLLHGGATCVLNVLFATLREFATLFACLVLDPVCQMSFAVDLEERPVGGMAEAWKWQQIDELVGSFGANQMYRSSKFPLLNFLCKPAWEQVTRS